MEDIKTISQLLDYYENLEYDINKVDFDNLNINNLIVDIHEDKIFCITLGHIKLLEYCNFNFELIDVKDILYYCNNNVIYLIENNLYEFLTKDKYTILTYCDFDLFAYFINYLDINVEENYDNHSLYYYISTDKNFTSNHLKEQIIQKYKYLYDNYKLRLLESDICKEEIYVFILSIYDINYLEDLNKDILTNLLYSTNILSTYGEYINHTNLNYILDKLGNDIDINILHIICDYPFILKHFFNKIIDNLNLDIATLVNHIANNIYRVTIFYFYYTHYDENIINYTKFIFKCETYEEFINKYDYIFDGKEFKEYYANL